MHSDHHGTRFKCPIDPRSNLPVALAKTPCHNGDCNFGDPVEDQEQRCSIATMSVFDETNQNITVAQKELLLWHNRLGHLGFAHVQKLMLPVVAASSPTDSPSSKPETNEPCIVPKHPTARTCKPPLCTACQIARAKKRTADVSTTVIHKDMLLKVDDLQRDDHERMICTGR